uniref:Uncharacterized protein n=1 Tax=Timema poppense TaxID=170557 RepID=A0A7R9HGV8_TIMPO|nr:unnamed protein product [Timema poppensis]
MDHLTHKYQRYLSRKKAPLTWQSLYALLPLNTRRSRDPPLTIPPRTSSAALSAGETHHTSEASGTLIQQSSTASIQTFLCH